VSAPHSSEEYVDVALELASLEVEEAIAAVNQQPDDAHVAALARRMRSLNLAASRILPCYGKEYEGRGRKFIDVGLCAQRAAFAVPERVTREDPGADRSAHALICRSTLEIAASVHQHCALAMQNAGEKR
jgi:hypothetical protein